MSIKYIPMHYLGSVILLFFQVISLVKGWSTNELLQSKLIEPRRLSFMPSNVEISVECHIIFGGF